MSKANCSSCIRLSNTPRNLSSSPSLRDAINDDSPSFIPSLFKHSPLLTWMTAHFLEFHSNPISLIADLIDFRTLPSLLSEAAITFKSSIYNKCVMLVLMGLERQYPSVALSFHATGLIQNVNNRGQRLSPWGSPLLNRIKYDFSKP